MSEQLPPMETWADYAREVQRTMEANHQEGEISLGLIGEIGEAMGKFKSWEYHGALIDTLESQYPREIGDVWWYATAGAIVMGIDPSSCGRVNMVIERTHPIDNMIPEKMIKRFVGMTISASYLALTMMNPPEHQDKNQFVDNLCVLIEGLIMSTTLTPQEIWAINRNKLRTRFPDGFNKDDSRNRVENQS